MASVNHDTRHFRILGELRILASCWKRFQIKNSNGLVKRTYLKLRDGTSESGEVKIYATLLAQISALDRNRDKADS
jgi:hypothetical protein